MKSTTSHRLTQTQFFAACKALEGMKEFVLAELPTKTNVARMVKEVVGFPVSEANLVNIMEATGIQWKSKRPTKPKSETPKKKRVGGTRHRSHTLKLALIVKQLLQRLGEESPKELEEVISYLSQREGV